MKRILVTMMVLALTIGAQAQQDDGMDAMMAAMIAAKVQNLLTTSCQPLSTSNRLQSPLYTDVLTT